MIVHFVCSVWFFRTWNPDAHWSGDLFPWELWFGSSYIVLVRLPLVCAYCPQHVFLAGDRHISAGVSLSFLASCAFAWGCACKKTRGFLYIFIAFFLMDPSKWQATGTLPPHPLNLSSAAARKALLLLTSECYCSVSPKPGFPKWKNTDCKAAITYRPRKENPFSAAAHWNGPADGSPAAKGRSSVMTHGCSSTGLPAPPFSVAHSGLCLGGEEEEEKLQQVTQERSSAVPAASSEGKRDLFYPKAQSAPFPQGTVACSGWRRSVLTLTVLPPSPLDVVVVGGGKPIRSHRLFLFFLKQQSFLTTASPSCKIQRAFWGGRRNWTHF